MSGRTLYIEEHEDDSTPVTGCGCERDRPLTFGECDPVTDGALTAGDPSPCARCPDCDGLIYLDRPIDRATDAVRDLVRALEAGYPPGDSNLLRLQSRLSVALSEARPGLKFNLTIA